MTFVKGVSGNPKGKPKGSLSLIAMLKRKLQELPENEKRTYAEMFIVKYIKEALGGKGEMLRDAFDRVDGKPPQALHLTGKDGGSTDMKLTIEFVDKTSVGRIAEQRTVP